MAMGTRPCGCAGVQPTVIIYDDGSAPPMVGNRVTLERPNPPQQWSGLSGLGIGIEYELPDTSAGHQPRISVRLSPFSPIPLGFDQAGRIKVGPVDVADLESNLLVNAGVEKQGGVQVVQGGASGHAVTIAVTPSAVSGSSRVWIGADGGLAVDPPAPFTWEVVVASGNTRTLKLKNGLTGASITLGTV